MEDEEDQDNQTSLPLRRSARKGTRAIYAEMSDEGDDDPGTSMGNRALDDRTDENQATSNNKNDSENDSVQVIRVKAEPEDPDINLLLAGTAPMPEDEADHEVEMSDDSTRPGAMGPPSTLPKHRLRNFPEEEEEKPKPVMGLRYQGYTVPDICLAIIVEPRHPDDRGHSRASSREPSVTVRGTDGNLSRYLGAGPIGRLSITPAPEARKQTPLPLFREFTPLPGESDDFREKTPAPSGSSAPVMFGRAHSPIPAFNNDLDSAFEGEYPAELELDGEVEELLHFSQAMNPNRVGGIGGEESDEDDARVLLADADEGR
ncbi:hypothetical protein FRC03_012426 [Tulasnella sp. 419]|nr:hypothetical protein FRC03_012426 [Tulasnella sp. 419]